MNKQKFGVKTIVAIGIGAAIFFLLARFVAIPIPLVPNTSFAFQYAVNGLFATVFGPIAGLLTGFIGHTIADLTWGSPWWSWIAVSAITGGATGLLMRGNKVEEGEFGKRDIIKFVIGSVVIHLIGWALLAPTMDVLFYAEPADKVYLQGVVAGLANGIFTAILGTLLIFAYSKTRTKTGSLGRD